MTKLEKTVNLMKEENTYRRFADGDHKYSDFSEDIFNEDKSHKCPTYVHKTPPCQGSCPSGEDIRGWLQIVRGIEKAPEGMTMSEYAFRRSTTDPALILLLGDFPFPPGSYTSHVATRQQTDAENSFQRMSAQMERSLS